MPPHLADCPGRCGWYGAQALKTKTGLDCPNLIFLSPNLVNDFLDEVEFLPLVFHKDSNSPMKGNCPILAFLSQKGNPRILLASR